MIIDVPCPSEKEASNSSLDAEQYAEPQEK